MHYISGFWECEFCPGSYFKIRNKRIAIETSSAEETRALAKALGEALRGGEVLALQGDLGAGKTCFVQGLAQGLNVPDHVYVRSPSFTILDCYEGSRTIHHLDLYRLAEPDELELIGIRDCLDGESILAVEWADRFPESLPADRIEITIEIGEEDQR